MNERNQWEPRELLIGASAYPKVKAFFEILGLHLEPRNNNQWVLMDSPDPPTKEELVDILLARAESTEFVSTVSNSSTDNPSTWRCPICHNWHPGFVCRMPPYSTDHDPGDCSDYIEIVEVARIAKPCDLTNDGWAHYPHFYDDPNTLVRYHCPGYFRIRPGCGGTQVIEQDKQDNTGYHFRYLTDDVWVREIDTWEDEGGSSRCIK